MAFVRTIVPVRDQSLGKGAGGDGVVGGEVENYRRSEDLRLVPPCKIFGGHKTLWVRTEFCVAAPPRPAPARSEISQSGGFGPLTALAGHVTLCQAIRVIGVRTPATSADVLPGTSNPELGNREYLAANDPQLKSHDPRGSGITDLLYGQPRYPPTPPRR